MRKRDKVYLAKSASMVLAALWTAIIFLTLLYAFTGG